MAESNLSAERLREFVHYDSETGIFTWRVQSGRQKAGDIAGWNQGGRRVMKVDGSQVQAHRAAWLYVYWHWPTMQIDHINGDPIDNRIDNLRDVSDRDNKQNIRQAQRNNRSGFLGVAPNKSRWMAKITVDRKQICLGTYDTPELAYEAYLAAKRELHSSCTI